MGAIRLYEVLGTERLATVIDQIHDLTRSHTWGRSWALSHAESAGFPRRAQGSHCQLGSLWRSPPVVC
jgi:hypothetical protein